MDSTGIASSSISLAALVCGILYMYLSLTKIYLCGIGVHHTVDDYSIPEQLGVSRFAAYSYNPCNKG